VDFVSTPVVPHTQADDIRPDLSNAILCFTAFGLPGGHVNLFRSYLSNRKPQVHVYGIIFSHFEFLSRIPLQCLTTYAMQLPTRKCTFSDDIRVYRAVKPPQDRNLLQSTLTLYKASALLFETQDELN
jgi:hypothetical protein